MTPLPTAPDFEASIGDLQQHLPDALRASDPTSELYKLLAAWAVPLDALWNVFQQIADDQVLTTASDQGLARNFGTGWGLTANETRLAGAQLEQYIQALALDDGSIVAMTNVLNRIVNNPNDLIGGTIATFPGGGGGLTFPANGTGIALYEFAAGGSPPTVSELVFPLDGTGLTFPADSSGLLFSYGPLVQIIVDFANWRMTVQVPNWLSFDRRVFASAVARFQYPDWLPIVVQEVVPS